MYLKPNFQENFSLSSRMRLFLKTMLTKHVRGPRTQESGVGGYEFEANLATQEDSGSKQLVLSDLLTFLLSSQLHMNVSLMLLFSLLFPLTLSILSIFYIMILMYR